MGPGVVGTQTSKTSQDPLHLDTKVDQLRNFYTIEKLGNFLDPPCRSKIEWFAKPIFLDKMDEQKFI